MGLGARYLGIGVGEVPVGGVEFGEVSVGGMGFGGVSVWRF